MTDPVRIIETYEAFRGHSDQQWAAIDRAVSEIAYVAGELQAVRDCGFTEAALHYPRSPEGLALLCAFNGIKPEQAPPGWRYWPNRGMKACWERVATVAREIGAQQPKDADRP